MTSRCDVPARKAGGTEPERVHSSFIRCAANTRRGRRSATSLPRWRVKQLTREARLNAPNRLMRTANLLIGNNNQVSRALAGGARTVHEPPLNQLQATVLNRPDDLIFSMIVHVELVAGAGTLETGLLAGSQHGAEIKNPARMKDVGGLSDKVRCLLRQEIRQPKGTDDPVETPLKLSQMPAIVHRELGIGNRLTGKLNHARGKIDTQQIQIRPLRHKVTRHIPRPTRRIQYPRAAWPEQFTELPIRTVVLGQVHVLLPVQIRQLVKGVYRNGTMVHDASEYR